MELLSRLARPARLMGLALLLAVTVAATPERPLESAVKSVYLFKFGDYVEWPEGSFPTAESPFIIGVLGADPLGASLDEAVRGRKVGGRSIVVRRFERVEQVLDLHVLYISPQAADPREKIQAALAKRAILTVSDKSTDAGAMIEFVRQGTKVRFEVDAGAASRAGVRLRSELLTLAVVVKRSG